MHVGIKNDEGPEFFWFLFILFCFFDLAGVINAQVRFASRPTGILSCRIPPTANNLSNLHQVSLVISEESLVDCIFSQVCRARRSFGCAYLISGLLVATWKYLLELKKKKKIRHDTYYWGRFQETILNLLVAVNYLNICKQKRGRVTLKCLSRLGF